MLDTRQRAMLREMGVQVWQRAPDAPAPVLALPASIPAALDAPRDAPRVAIDLVAARADTARAAGTIDAQITAQTGAVRGTAPQTAPGPAATGVAPGWHLGEALVVRATPSEGPRWLLLAETPAASLRAQPFEPFAGDAGKLLANMLRAARLDPSAPGAQPGHAGEVLLAPLARVATGGTAADALPDALAALVAQTRPDVVLVMGRLAAQAVLQSSEPLGKLRGQVHRLHGTKVVVTYDAAVLLRSPLEKAKAWEDLCLAIEVSQHAP
ncbi:uracil-DNA glycosylase family protein [Polaromonas sp.]|jgi:DNA polymerase|uniref:uracil-DNA glycosylase family protein n=1 Tax=Polaromonas sp. TaxID=1869339 RepID=UPI002C37FBC6|nr:uracil-DNA glycosylase family protein [Polaromonas sp.]HQS31653.1 uracil-DNA glycosylase family protein [Polaromonas sp.]HQS92199.1 uracil-DNA glycosylase family protein [Polaromonas sp.]